jgi:hypothetical protein
VPPGNVFDRITPPTRNQHSEPLYFYTFITFLLDGSLPSHFSLLTYSSLLSLFLPFSFPFHQFQLFVFFSNVHIFSSAQSNLFKREIRMTAEQSRLEQNPSTIVICMAVFQGQSCKRLGRVKENTPLRPTPALKDPAEKKCYASLFPFHPSTQQKPLNCSSGRVRLRLQGELCGVGGIEELQG